LCIGVNAIWSVFFPTGLIVNALGILFAVAVSIAGGALLYRVVESRPGVLGINLTTALLIMGVLATLAIEAFTR
jgi:hypothetical protein